MTFDELVQKHNELLSYVTDEDAEHDARMKPYRDGINTIKATILTMLQEQKLQNVKTEHGTPYQHTSMSVKVDNRSDFLSFLAAQDKWDMLDARALKDPVQDWLDKHDGVPPSGIKVEYFTKCNIRGKS